MDLVEARQLLATALAPVTDTDPDVISNLVDTLDPPALMLGWGEPWLQRKTACIYDGRMLVTAVGARFVPGSGIEQLESLIGYTVGKLQADNSQSWVVEQVSGPRVFQLGNTNYIASRLTVLVTIT